MVNLNQSNTIPKTLINGRITNLQEFIDSGITEEQILWYGKLQDLYTREDRLDQAKIVFRVSLVLLCFGLVAVFVSLGLIFVYNSYWSYAITTLLSLTESFFLWAFKHIVQHYYPIIKNETSKD